MRPRFFVLFGLICPMIVALAQAQQPPVFTTQPDSIAAYVGDPVTLTVAATGDAPITWQWHKNALPITGATGPTISFPAVTLSDTGVYYVLATNPSGTVSSSTATLFVTKRPQTIAFAPAVTTAIAGSSLAISATATSQLPVALTLVSGSATISGGLLTGDGGTVIVRATQAGNDFFDAAEPVERTFSFVVNGLSPAITSAPADQTVALGAAVTFRASAIGTPAPTFQWQKDGVAIAGATTSLLTIASATLADAGRYTILASNVRGVASATAILNVRAAPVIVASPASRAIFAGEGVSFSVSVAGFPAPTFQWRRNGTPILGATNATFTIASTVATDAGRYDVVVTNSLGSATSEAATLTLTVRDFSGAYFGRFVGGAGNIALLVRPDRTAVLLGHLSGAATGLAVLDGRVDLNGRFSASTLTLGAAPRTVALRGTVDEVAGTVTGDITVVGVTFDATRAPRSGTATASAGLFSHALVGSSAGRGHAIVGADGQALLLLLNNTAVDSARGTLSGAGRLALNTTGQAALDVTFNGGFLAGTLRTGNVTANLAGAIEALTGTERLINLSVRSLTSPGAATLITGFVVGGTAGKQVLVRAAGPALAVAPFNLPGVLPDPVIQLQRGGAIVGQNDDWGTPAANVATITAAATRAGAFPFRAGSGDAAIVTTLQPGAATVTIGGGTGTVLAEVYEVLDPTEAPGARRLINVSARGVVAPNSPFIAGFVIAGNAPQRVLLRGIGPTLGAAPFNVAGALPNPDLTLFRGAATVKSNDDWFRDPDATLIRDTAARVGAFSLGATSPDAAILIYLEPGAYTAQVGVPANANPANTTGLALVEIYEANP